MRVLSVDEIAMVSGASIDPEITVVVSLGSSLFGFSGGLGAGGFEFPSVGSIDLSGLEQYGTVTDPFVTTPPTEADMDADGIPDDAIVVSAARVEEISVGIPDFASGGTNYITFVASLPALIDCNRDGKPDIQKAMDGNMYALNEQGQPIGKVVGPVTITKNGPGVNAEASVSITGPVPGANGSVTYNGATTSCSYQYTPF